MRPHYEIRFADGRTPFDARTVADVDAVFKSHAEFEGREMQVRGVGTRRTVAEIFGDEETK